MYRTVRSIWMIVPDDPPEMSALANEWSSLKVYEKFSLKTFYVPS